MNNIAPKLQKCWTHEIAFKIISKMLKQPNFFHSQPSTLPEEVLAKFYLPTLDVRNAKECKPWIIRIKEAASLLQNLLP